MIDEAVDCFEAMDDRRCETFVMVVFGILAAIIFAVVQVTGIHSSVTEGYYPYADAMMNGVFPYTDEVFVYGYWNVWEYPPLAYAFMLVPRLLSDSVAVYQAVYLVMVLVFLWIGMRSVSVIADDRGYSRTKAVLMYASMMILMAEFVFDRYDVLRHALGEKNQILHCYETAGQEGQYRRRCYRSVAFSISFFSGENYYL